MDTKKSYEAALKDYESHKSQFKKSVKAQLEKDLDEFLDSADIEFNETFQPQSPMFSEDEDNDVDSEYEIPSPNPIPCLRPSILSSSSSSSSPSPSSSPASTVSNDDNYLFDSEIPLSKSSSTAVSNSNPYDDNYLFDTEFIGNMKQEPL